MNTAHAKPGDTIEITVENNFLGQQFLVVECPPDKQGGDLSECAWVEHGGSTVAVVHAEDYEITDHGFVASSDVDSLLKRQLNDNLRKMFA